MFGILATLFAGGYLAGEGLMKSVKSSSARDEAIAEGKATYVDANMKTRSVETNEICTWVVCDYKHRGHSVISGVHTGRIYEDITEKKYREKNEQLRKEGKRYIWKEYPNLEYEDSKFRGKARWMPYDLDKHMPFNCKWHITAAEGVTYEVVYYKEPAPDAPKTCYPKWDHFEKLSKEEGEKLNHIGQLIY